MHLWLMETGVCGWSTDDADLGWIAHVDGYHVILISDRFPGVDPRETARDAGSKTEHVSDHPGVSPSALP
jgi:hypothetical protein